MDFKYLNPLSLFFLLGGYLCFLLGLEYFTVSPCLLYVVRMYCHPARMLICHSMLQRCEDPEVKSVDFVLFQIDFNLNLGHGPTGGRVSHAESSSFSTRCFCVFFFLSWLERMSFWTCGRLILVDPGCCSSYEEDFRGLDDVAVYTVYDG